MPPRGGCSVRAGCAQVLLVEFNPLVYGHFPHQLADEVEGDFIGFFEPDAALAHVEFPLVVLGVLGLKPFEQFVVGIYAHVVEVDGVFSRGDGCERQGRFWIAVVTGGIEGVGNDVFDGALADDRFETRGQVVAHGLVELFEWFGVFRREIREKVIDGFFVCFHCRGCGWVFVGW